MMFHFRPKCLFMIFPFGVYCKKEMTGFPIWAQFRPGGAIIILLLIKIILHLSTLEAEARGNEGAGERNGTGPKLCC